MDSTVIAAIIGAVSTVGASIGTLVLTRLFDNISFSPKNVRQIALTGRWEGTVRWDGGQGTPLDMQFVLTSKYKRRTIRVDGGWKFTWQNQDITQDVTMLGTFVYDRFLKLEYKRVNQPGEINFGFALLELSPDGQTLNGHFVGSTPLSPNIIWGTVQGYKQGATPVPAQINVGP